MGKHNPGGQDLDNFAADFFYNPHFREHIIKNLQPGQINVILQQLGKQQLKNDSTNNNAGFVEDLLLRQDLKAGVSGKDFLTWFHNHCIAFAQQISTQPSEKQGKEGILSMHPPTWTEP